jgi:predicted DNA-binding protein (MmcQ/YjbR family)
MATPDGQTFAEFVQVYVIVSAPKRPNDMDIEKLREYCLAKPATEEGFPFDSDTLVIKAGGKIFAFLPLEHGDRISLKCDPDRAVELRAQWEEIEPGYHLNKQHWNSVMLRGRLPAELILELVDHSYDLIVKSLTKKVRAEYGL